MVGTQILIGNLNISSISSISKDFVIDAILEIRDSELLFKISSIPIPLEVRKLILVSSRLPSEREKVNKIFKIKLKTFRVVAPLQRVRDMKLKTVQEKKIIILISTLDRQFIFMRS